MNRRRLVVSALLGAVVLPTVAFAAVDFVYDEPQTGYYSIHPMSFAPDGADLSGGYFNSWRTGKLSPDSNQQQCLNTGVNLPDGAKIQEVQVWFSSNGAHDLYTTLTRTALATGQGRTIGGGSFTDSSGNRVTRTRAVDTALAQIDNAKYQYGFGVCIQSQTVFQGARIKYTYTRAGD